MRLRLLGVNGPFPAAGGATSGYLLEADGQAVQFDLGSGVLSRLTACCPPENLRALFLSHWHFDHACDLLPLIYRLEARSAVLPVYAPADESSALRKIAAQAACLELHDICAGDTVSLGGLTVRVGPARHPVPGVGFRAEAEGKVLGYTGDTNTVPGLVDFYRGCGLMLADGLFPTDAWAEGKPHLSAALAAELARDAGAESLILTHLNPLIPAERLLEEARAVFPSAGLAEAGAEYTL